MFWLQFCAGWARLQLRLPLRVSATPYQQDGSLADGHPCSGVPDHLKTRSWRQAAFLGGGEEPGRREVGGG